MRRKAYRSIWMTTTTTTTTASANNAPTAHRTASPGLRAQSTAPRSLTDLQEWYYPHKGAMLLRVADGKESETFILARGRCSFYRVSATILFENDGKDSI